MYDFSNIPASSYKKKARQEAKRHIDAAKTTLDFMQGHIDYLQKALKEEREDYYMAAYDFGNAVGGAPCTVIRELLMVGKAYSDWKAPNEN